MLASTLLLNAEAKEGPLMIYRRNEFILLLFNITSASINPGDSIHEHEQLRNTKLSVLMSLCENFCFYPLHIFTYR